MGKENNISGLFLTPNYHHGVRMEPTCYRQGRGNKDLYGSPYKICIGFPQNFSKLNYEGKVKEQMLLAKEVQERTIDVDDFFGSSDFLAIMINGGVKATRLAYTIGHLKLLELQNPNTKVRCDFMIFLY
jgi:hypothetical protein